ncbi:MAG: hypothetical protein HQL50_12340 [Magnetococcales bacterium]|nr:hypothetical protein [Magnetococcales bacterium]
MPFGTLQKIPVCTGTVLDGEAFKKCNAVEWQTVYVFDPASATFMEDFLAAGGVVWDDVLMAFGACFSLWATGVGVGLVLKMINKARR